MTQQSPRCAIYTRQSRTNDSSFASCDAQLGICREMVSSIGWRLVDVFQDPGSSSETLARPEMQRLMACAEHGQFEHVVVYAVDRLTRRLFDFARLIELFDKSGVKLTVGNGKSEYHVVHKFGFKLKTGHSLMSGPSVVELQARLIPRQSSCL